MPETKHTPVSREGKDPSGRPLVSVILAVRNERTYIENVLDSLMQQHSTDFDLEILVVDGKSSDGTQEIALRMANSDSRIRILVNEKQKTPFAFNLGLRESRGEFVCILGAHAVYDRDYVSTCLNEIRRRGATACGGIVNTWPANDSLQARLVAWTLGHSFGSSTNSFRTRGQGFTDGVNFPVMIKSAVIEVGGYDEQLHRNQDNDLNQRLRARGYKLFLTAETRCRYFTKSSLRSLLEYAFRSGSWNLLSWQKNKHAMRLRHFVPFLFVSAFISAFGLWIAAYWLPQPYHHILMLPAFLILGTHLTCGTLSAIQVGMQERSFGALLLPIIFLSFHSSYGFGTAWAVLTCQKLPVSENG
jgi:succinoglycan biosynthesis protein ExoA